VVRETARSASLNQSPMAAPDLFDSPPVTCAVEPPPGSAASWKRRQTSTLTPPLGTLLWRIAARGLNLGAVCALLRIPLWMTMAMVCAVVTAELFAQWRRVSRVYWTVLLAVVAAQATSLFVTPFTWPMRFIFFFVLVGAGVFFYGTQTNDLS
jgi:hypothetical protein